MGIDDLLRQIQEDEEADALEVLEFMTIGAYARSKRIRPQQVHYYIKNGRIEKLNCPCCGTMVIRVSDANAVFGATESTRAGVRVDLMDEEEGDG